MIHTSRLPCFDYPNNINLTVLDNARFQVLMAASMKFTSQKTLNLVSDKHEAPPHFLLQSVPQTRLFSYEAFIQLQLYYL
jgi:hypothetical protein